MREIGRKLCNPLNLKRNFRKYQKILLKLFFLLEKIGKVIVAAGSDGVSSYQSKISFVIKNLLDSSASELNFKVDETYPRESKRHS